MVPLLAGGDSGELLENSGKVGHLRKGDLFLEMLLHVPDRIADDEASGGVFLLFALLFSGRFLPASRGTIYNDRKTECIFIKTLFTIEGFCYMI